MRTIFKWIFGFSLLAVCLDGFSQYPFPNKKIADLVLGRTLVVQLLEEESDVETAMNLVIREAFDESWNLTEVQFANSDEVKSLRKQKSGDHSFLIQPSRLRESTRYEFEYLNGDLKDWVMGGSQQADVVQKESMASFELGNISLEYHDFLLTVFDGKKEKVATNITFINDRLGKHDYYFLNQQLAILLQASSSGIMRADYVDVDGNIAELSKSKVHLLGDYFEGEDQELILKSMGDLEFDLMSFSEYQSMILNRPENESYIKLIYSYMHNKFMWIMVKASSGQILSINECSDFKFSGAYPANKMINPRHLKFAVDRESQLLNDYYNR